MKARIVLCLLLIVSLLAPKASYARWMNPGTGRFHTMDTFEGDQRNPQSLHKYTYAHNDPVNRKDPSGNMIEGVLTVLDISGVIIAQVSPTTAKAASAATALPALPSRRDAQLLTGLIFAESSSRDWPRRGGGENEQEKIEMGLTVLNRTHYSQLRGPHGYWNGFFGNGTVLGALQVPGEFQAYNGERWNLVMRNNNLKSVAELNKLQFYEKEHLRLSVEAANFCTDGNPPPPTGVAGVGQPPSLFPVAFNRASNSPPGPRMFKFVRLGSHSFYAFKAGREAE